MSKRWVYGPGISLGSEEVSVSKLIEDHGPVRPGFLAKTGFETLHSSSEEESSLTLGAGAANALGGDWWRSQVDAVISVSSTPQLQAPGNGHLLHSELNLPKDILVLDINDACTGFVRSLVVADSLLESGAASSVLIVIADTYTKLYDPSELKVSPLFSDGASAIILSKAALESVPDGVAARKWEVLASTFLSEGGNAAELCISRSPERESGHLYMNGGAVFNFVLRNLASQVAALSERSETVAEDVEQWYVHQGSRAVVNAVEKSLHKEADSLFRSVNYGNVVGSSIPFQLEAETGVGTPNSVIGFLAFGVGLTMAGAYIRQSAV